MEMFNDYQKQVVTAMVIGFIYLIIQEVWIAIIERNKSRRLIENLFAKERINVMDYIFDRKNNEKSL